MPFLPCETNIRRDSENLVNIMTTPDYTGLLHIQICFTLVGIANFARCYCLHYTFQHNLRNASPIEMQPTIQ
jgi:hypothetical protein